MLPNAPRSVAVDDVDTSVNGGGSLNDALAGSGSLMSMGAIPVMA